MANRQTTTECLQNARPVPAAAFFWRCLHYVFGLLFVLFLAGGISWFHSEKVLSGNADFTIFYTGIRLVLEYPASQLYNLEIQGTVQRQILGGATLARALLPYNHPPFEVLLLLPLGLLSYTRAFLVWLGVNLCSILCLPWIIAAGIPSILSQQKRTLLLAALSFYPFFVCLIQGQDSLLFLWCVLWTYILMKRARDFFSGVVLGLAFFKFHIAFFLVVPLILKRRGRALVGLTCCLACLTLVSTLWVGLPGIGNYLDLLLELSVTDGPSGFIPQRFQNWMGQIYLLGFSGVHSRWGMLTLGLVAVLVLRVLWRGEWNVNERSFGLRFAATVLLALLASPHLYIHDLSAVFLVLCLVLEFLLLTQESSESVLLMALLACSPFVWIFTLTLSQEIPIQLSVVWMSVMLSVILAILRRSPDRVHLV